MSPSPKSVLITGCSAGGIGSALAVEFQRRGLRVFATARNLGKMEHLGKLPNVTLLQLDVTSTDSITVAAHDVVAATGGSLDILINNSGSQYITPVVEADLDRARSLFDVNVFGVIAVCQAFAPLLVSAHGTIVNVCSINGHVHTPWMGLYGASKAAVEMVSETMRLELAPLGVRVVSLVTGAVTTNIMTNGPVPQLPETSLFKPAEKEMTVLARGEDEHPRMPVDAFAKKVVDDVLGAATGKVWRGQMASMIYWFTKLAPLFVVDRMISKGTGVDHLAKK
ncbi:NAD(P)-binding protein [Byssothecium circinans]|uniref:NAD(P)-binding protein n=1 Tax=Byssothecium circinans TaxID=147558 RepID=A0A6A5TZ66_9PLEO|nr:NAD(P)-binding protein [Byssothecium circinans]